MANTKMTRLKQPIKSDEGNKENEKKAPIKKSRKAVPAQKIESEQREESRLLKVARLFDLDTRKKLVLKLLKDERSIHAKRAVIDKLDHLPFDSRSKNFTYQTVANDGNSLYRSLSYLLFGVESYHNQIRQAIFAYMREHKKQLDETCGYLTDGMYHTVESYIRETRADQFGRLPNGLVEIEAAALYFNVPVFLFTRPIHVKPTVFHLTKKFDEERGFVLFDFHRYFRPVCTFDGVNFQHTELAHNPNSVVLQARNGYSTSVGINELDAISTALCTDVVVHNPFATRLDEDSLKSIKDFLRYKSIYMGLDLRLFNFCCRYKCFPIIENIIACFKAQCVMGAVQPCADFIEGLADVSKMYSGELVQHFRDMCFAVPGEVLLNLKVTTDLLKNLVDEVIEKRKGYVTCTETVDVKTSDDKLAFRDVIPYTVVCFDYEKKTVMYFSGPKPESRGWIPLQMNRRLMEAADKIIHPDHVLFSGCKIFFYNENNTGEKTVGVVNNAFHYHSYLNYQLPTRSKKIGSVHLVNSDIQEPLLVDKENKQVYNLLYRTWLNVQDMIELESTDDYEIWAITVIASKHEEGEDRKRRVILRKATSKSLFGFASTSFSLSHQLRLPFQYTISRSVKDFTVKTRLADQNITMRPDKAFEENQQMMYKTDKPVVHYAVPKPKGSYQTFALLESNVLNDFVGNQRITDHSRETADFFVQYTDSNSVLALCKQIGFPTQAMEKYMASEENDKSASRKMISEWYPVARKHCKSSMVLSPERILGVAYKESRQGDLFEKFITEHEDRKIIREHYSFLRGQVIENIFQDLAKMHNLEFTSESDDSEESD